MNDDTEKPTQSSAPASSGEVTERSAAEANELLMDALESSPAGVALYDADDRLVIFNDRFRNGILPGIADLIVPGVSYEDLVRAAVERGMAEVPDGDVEKYVRMRLAHHRKGEGSLEVKLANGRWMLSHERRMAGGGIIGTRSDITDRKRAEQRLRANEERFKDFAEASSDWFWEMDADLRFSYMSPSVERSVGVAPEWHYGKTRQDLLGEDYDREAWDEHLRTLSNHQAFRNFTYRRVGPNVDTKWLSTSGLPIFSEDGEFLGYRGTGRDVTPAVLAEEALREAEARFRGIFEQAAMGIGLMTLDGQFLTVNKRLCDLMGCAEEELLGMRFEAFTHPDDYRKCLARVNDLVTGKVSTVSIEMRYQPKDRELMWGLLTVSVIREVANDQIALLGIVEDITEAKKTEAELRQARKMEALGQLTGGLAHDFNNLLAVIMGHAELMQERLGDQDKSARAVIRAATRGAELSQRLLAFSRQQALNPRAIDLAALIEGVTDLLRASLGAPIEIKAVACANAWKALADQGQLENALLNLAINARDAMPDGGRLTIETANVTLGAHGEDGGAEIAPGDYVTLAVSDTGTGMPADVVERAFDPFFTTKEVGAGSGLGLSMVYGFAKQSNGRVTIESEEGRGTAVRLYLPRADETRDQEKAAEAARDDPKAHGETVLVVEDDADIRSLAVNLLDGLGYRVLEAEDGQAALAAMADNGRIDLLLSDVMLPGGMSGIDVEDEVRRRHADVKVLFMTGYADSVKRLQGRLDNGAQLLNKPFRRRDLARKVRVLLDQGKMEP